MLEESSCLVSRTLASSCEQEAQWTYMAYRVGVDVELSNGKRRIELDVEEEEGLRKASKVSDHEKRLSPSQFDRLSLTLATPTPTDGSSSSNSSSNSDSEQQSIDQVDMDCLIHPIGRDLTINCLIRCPRADHGLIASLNKSFHALIKSGELNRLRKQNKVVEPFVFFSCRLLEWVAFDPNTQRWMKLPKMNCNECFACSDKESLAVGNELLVFGKDYMSHVIYKYSILTNSWSSGMSMNFPRCLFGSASLGHIAILAGGCDSQGNVLNSAELYDSEKQTWVTLPNMIKPRKMCSGFFMDGKFHVIGGVGGNNGQILTCCEEFDLKKKTWKEIPNMYPGNHGTPPENGIPTSTAAPPLVAVVNNELYAAVYADMGVKKFNKETRAWTTVGRLPERAASMNGWGLAFRACGNRLIVVGGPKGRGEGVIEVNSWVPSEGGPPEWLMLGSKDSGSFVYNCAVMEC